MKKRVISAGLTIAGGLAIAAACSRPQAESVSAKVDKLFAQWDRPGSPGCALGVSRNGVPVYEHGYGVANLELRIPITPSSVFGAASISKQFTAMSILLLAGRAQLSLDDEVSKFVPEWVDHEHHVTIRHLLTHTSGLIYDFTQHFPFNEHNLFAQFQTGYYQALR